MKKKIAFYIDSLNRGGTEKATVDLINNLNLDKYDVTLIKFFPGGEYADRVKKEINTKTKYPIVKLFAWNKKIEHIVKWWGRNFFDRLPGKLSHKLLIGSSYDVEIACGYYFPTKIIESAPSAKKISWVHMDYSIDKSDIGNFSKKEGQDFFGNMDKIVCVSKECEERFNDKFDLPKLTTTRYNIIETEKILNKSDEFQVTEFDDNLINIVTIGRLTWQKGYDRLINVYNRVLKREKKCHLYIIGEGEDYEKLKQQIDSFGINQYITLLGYVKNPYPYVKRADLFVCSSRHESFSLVVAESLVLGTPVISTKCTGPNELLEYGKYGKLVDNDDEALYRGLLELVSNQAEINMYKEKAVERKDFFDTKKSVEKWEELLDE